MYERDRFEVRRGERCAKWASALIFEPQHDHLVLKQALENAREQVQALQKISLDKDAEFGRYRNEQVRSLPCDGAIQH